MDVTWQSCHRNPVDKATKQYWFSKLEKHQMAVVGQAFDTWIMNNRELPTLMDIIKLCKPKQDFYKALPLVRDDEICREGLLKIKQFVAKSGILNKTLNE